MEKYPSWLTELADEHSVLTFLMHGITERDLQDMLYFEGRHSPPEQQVPVSALGSLLLDSGPRFPTIPEKHYVELREDLSMYGICKSETGKEHLLRGLAYAILLHCQHTGDFREEHLVGFVQMIGKFGGRGCWPALCFVVWHMVAKGFEEDWTEHGIAILYLLMTMTGSVGPLLLPGIVDSRTLYGEVNGRNCQSGSGQPGSLRPSYEQWYPAWKNVCDGPEGSIALLQQVSHWIEEWGLPPSMPGQM